MSSLLGMPELFIFDFLQSPVFYAQYIVILIFSISLHELSHGWAALDQGDDTPSTSGHMTLNPVVHMGVLSLVMLCLYGFCWGAMPVSPSKFRSKKWGDILVSAAGPLMNLGLAFLFICLFNICCMRLGYSPLLQNFLAFCRLAVIVNFGLFFLNLIPLPPLDGFHVLSELIPSLKPLRGSPLGIAALIFMFVIGISIFELAAVASEFLLRPSC